MTEFDVAVIGGGPAGAVAAALLARAGRSVAVLEKARFPRRKVCGEYLGAAGAAVLDELGLAKPYGRLAGPEVRRVALYAGDTVLEGDMPRPFGRALGREALDMLLLARAEALGASVYQPCTLRAAERIGEGFECVASHDEAEPWRFRARLIIAAHGSWEPGQLLPRPASELLAFKAHFREARLPAHVMPLVAFPGGYGGLVASDAGRTTFSFCVRRDALGEMRARYPGVPAGEAALSSILGECEGVRAALGCAAREGAWLAAGPIRPGIGTLHRDGIYAVGNAAGEAHPIVAEGIGMAIGSAALLCDALLSIPDTQRAAAAYERAWRARFSTRVHASSVFARLAMSRRGARWSARMIARAPALLTFGARLSGKAHGLSRPANLRAAGHV